MNFIPSSAIVLQRKPMQSQQGPAYNTHGINLASSPWSMCTFISQQLVGFAHFLTCMIRRVEGAKFTVGENSCRSEVTEKEGYTSCRYSLESILKLGLRKRRCLAVLMGNFLHLKKYDRHIVPSLNYGGRQSHFSFGFTVHR